MIQVVWRGVTWLAPVRLCIMGRFDVTVIPIIN